MLFCREVEIDGVIYDIEYNVLFEYIPGEKPVYYGDLANPGEDPYFDYCSIDVNKINGNDANEYDSYLLDKIKIAFDYLAFEEEYLDYYIEKNMERSEDD